MTLPTPEEFETWVRRYLIREGKMLTDFSVRNLALVESPSGGEYEIDALAEFSILAGARIRVLAECKAYRNPVKRDTVLTVKAKRDEVAAHKAMVFSTGGFQAGAVEYAHTHGIALVEVTWPSPIYARKPLANYVVRDFMGGYAPAGYAHQAALVAGHGGSTRGPHLPGCRGADDSGVRDGCGCRR
jgi:hypothetical protein